MVDSWSKLEEIYSSFLLAKLNFFETLSKPALKGLTIAASTVAVVDVITQYLMTFGPLLGDIKKEGFTPLI